MADGYETFKSEYLRLSEIDLNSYKESQMKRRINNFMSKYQVRDYSGFLQLLKKLPIIQKYPLFNDVKLSLHRISTRIFVQLLS